MKQELFEQKNQTHWLSFTDMLDVLEADGDTAGCLPALITVEENPVSMLVPN